jgi:hypothetical protein
LCNRPIISIVARAKSGRCKREREKRGRERDREKEKREREREREALSVLKFARVSSADSTTRGRCDEASETTCLLLALAAEYKIAREQILCCCC